jgi:putative transposon-encoded protein
MIDMGHWRLAENVYFNEEKKPFGFIYRITCLVTNKKYIGKKQCVSVRKKQPLKGKVNKRHQTIETDWKSYTSSSREVNEDIIQYGQHNFLFEILQFCDSKFALAYYEAKLQFEEEVLLREDYYNGIINLRVSRPRVFKD